MYMYVHVYRGSEYIHCTRITEYSSLVTTCIKNKPSEIICGETFVEIECI